MGIDMRDKIPTTRAVIAIRKAGVSVRPHFVRYEKEAVTDSAAAGIGVTSHDVVKTLVMEDHEENSFIVLMHGDMQVSTKELARILGVKRVTPVTIKKAERLTGYMVGGISPFGTRRKLPVYIEESILQLPRFYINGGRRGFLVEMLPREIEEILKPIKVVVGRST